MSVSTAEVWTAMGDTTRREILARLSTQPRSVTELAAELPVSRPAVSQHLRVLKDAGLVRLHRTGRQHIYEARPEALNALKAELEAFWRQSLATFKQIAEADDRTGDRP
ncbi:ArsR/SmtB family transcription factor [Solicola gregarius]|uniref:Metalloregulator ArsR/SmtB family transcription factor n=1 Tax=Solicola gregarius TaxID=2908642 RepID=A0AA46YNB1_9ACTN|nr:metalloregulator ArsR/SmtB family transcription factor [Solicola gregarius]UYM07301.1 metalloregulator ArsR/SmtB family transcription factor [Solicola gregarius]